MQQFINQISAFVFGKYRQKKGGVFGPIHGPYFVFFYVEAGSCTIITDNKEFTISAGHCGFFACQKSIKYIYPANINTVCTWCEGYFGKMGKNNIEVIQKNPIILSITENQKLLLNIGLSLNSDSNPNLNEYRNSIGYSCLRSHYYELNKNTPHNKYPSFLYLAKSYIDGNYTDDSLKVSTLADIASVTEQHLISSFKKHIGITPSRYIWEKRAHFARKLLLETNLSQQEVAYQCGYKSIPHFCRKIKLQFGQTPNTIRNS